MSHSSAWFQIRKTTFSMGNATKVSTTKTRLPQFFNSLRRESSGQKRPAKVVKQNWTNLFDRSTNQPFFRCVYRFVISLNTRIKHIWFLLLITWWIMWLFLHGCTFCAGLCGLLRQFFGYLASFLYPSLAGPVSRHFSVLFRLISLTLTRSTSRHCSVLFRFLSLALTRSTSRHCSVLFRLLFQALTRSLSRFSWLLLCLLISALCRSLSRSAPVKPCLENVISTPP